MVVLATSSLYSKTTTHSGKTLKVLLLEKEQKVDALSQKLNVDELANLTLSKSARSKFEKALKKAQKELDSFRKKVILLKKDFDSIDPDNTISLKAKEILNTQGTTLAIEYLQTISKQQSIEHIQELQLLVYLLRFEDRHQEAVEVYEKLLESKELSNEQHTKVIATLTQYYSDAKYKKRRLKLNIEKLRFYRELAKSNPALYKPKIAEILYELISNYDDHEQYDNMLKAHNEALSLYRELKDKQKIVDTIYKGLYYAEYSKEVLEEAVAFLFKRKYKLLEEFSLKVHNAEVLSFLQSLLDREKHHLAIKHPQIDIYKLDEYWRIKGEFLRKLQKEGTYDLLETELKALKLLASTKKSFTEGKDYFGDKETISLKKKHYGMSLEKMMQDKWFLHEYRLSTDIVIVHKNRALIHHSRTDGFSISSGISLVIKSGKQLYRYNMGTLHAHIAQYP